jgi:N-acetylglucosaminyldiphosphoundecaprenol N-acetyl-beta-D-mannosaminyltransferase
MILNELFPKILKAKLCSMPSGKILINTINAHSYNVAKNDQEFLDSLKASDVLIPDGIGVVLAYKLLKESVKKIAGADLFYYEMDRLNKMKGSCFFLGSSDFTLSKIRESANKEFPNVKIAIFSPPYKSEFTEEENAAMINAVNQFSPDVLFIGMTAPKQEKWAFTHFDALNAKHVCSIGAVFDFYAGTINRAPKWMIALGLEWLGRLLKEPKRMWHRYLVSSPVIIKDVLLYKLRGKSF